MIISNWILGFAVDCLELPLKISPIPSFQTPSCSEYADPPMGLCPGACAVSVFQIQTGFSLDLLF